MKTSTTLSWLYLVISATLIVASTISAGFASMPISGQGVKQKALRVQKGLAVFYAAAYHGEKTASGETFNKNGFVAAHPTLPLGTIVRVTNLENKRAIEARIIDRGPSEKGQARGIIIDLSRAAAEALDFVKKGRARVQIEVLEIGKE